MTNIPVVGSILPAAAIVARCCNYTLTQVVDGSDLGAQRGVLPGRNVTGAVGADRFGRPLDQFEERLDDVDRHRKDHGGILFGAYLCQRLQVAQLHGGRNAREYLRGDDQGLRSLEFGLGMDDLGTAVAFRFRLFGDGTNHIFGKFDGSDLDVAYFDPPGLGLTVNNALHVGAELFALG